MGIMLIDTHMIRFGVNLLTPLCRVDILLYVVLYFARRRANVLMLLLNSVVKIIRFYPYIKDVHQWHRVII